MLYDYQQQVQQIISDEISAVVNPFDLTLYINRARGQVATSSGCLRQLQTLTLTAGQNSFPLSSITLTAPFSGVVYINEMASASSAGQQYVRMETRPFPWFFTYYLANGLAVANAVPNIWAQLSIGTTGVIYFSPAALANNVFLMDCVCTPSPLTNDGESEPLPYPYTDAVPYYASYLAFLNMKNAQAAQGMYALYQLFMKNAASQSVPTVLPNIFSGSAPSRMTSEAIPNTGVVGGGQR